MGTSLNTATKGVMTVILSVPVIWLAIHFSGSWQAWHDTIGTILLLCRLALYSTITGLLWLLRKTPSDAPFPVGKIALWLVMLVALAEYSNYIQIATER